MLVACGPADDSDRTSVVTNPYGGGNTTVSYTSNNVHEYTVIDSVNRTHDDNGNLTDDGTREFHYDYRNQLVRVTEDETVLAEYEYDALGRRTKKTVDADVTRYYHDGVHEIVEVDGSGALLRRYVYRDDIDSIAMMEAVDQADVDDDANTSELARLYFHVDPRTNVAYLSGPDESVVESCEYDPYGNVTIRDQAGDPVAASPVGNPFTFQRRRLDAETGLHYFRARHYDSLTGTWRQRDPSGLSDTANWNEFCHSTPTNFHDPDGLAGRIYREARDNGGHWIIRYVTVIDTSGPYDEREIERKTLRWATGSDEDGHYVARFDEVKTEYQVDVKIIIKTFIKYKNGMGNALMEDADALSTQMENLSRWQGRLDVGVPITSAAGATRKHAGLGHQGAGPRPPVRHGAPWSLLVKMVASAVLTGAGHSIYNTRSIANDELRGASDERQIGYEEQTGTETRVRTEEEETRSYFPKLTPDGGCAAGGFKSNEQLIAVDTVNFSTGNRWRK